MPYTPSPFPIMPWDKPTDIEPDDYIVDLDDAVNRIISSADSKSLLTYINNTLNGQLSGYLVNELDKINASSETQGYALAAKASEEAAAISETNAETSATASASSATASETSATASANSASASANSATASADSATASANSATASANSATASETSAASALIDADRAETAANTIDLESTFIVNTGGVYILTTTAHNVFYSPTIGGTDLDLDIHNLMYGQKLLVYTRWGNTILRNPGGLFFKDIEDYNDTYSLPSGGGFYSLTKVTTPGSSKNSCLITKM